MDTIKIETPEHIELEYELAGLGSRYIGVFVDHLIQSFVMFFLFIALVISNPNITSENPLEIFKSAFAGTIMVMMFLVSFAYFIFFETIWSGQTPGKKIAQIQVLKDNGEPIGFMEALLRNIFRLIDFFPFYYYVGIGLLWFRNDKKRVGDIIAHTIVVKQKANLKPVSAPELNVKTDLQINVSLINDQEYGLIRDFIISRHQLPVEDRIRIGNKLAAFAAEKLQMREVNVDKEEFLETIAVQYRSYKTAI
jgi:uncharacterized RDD family membrane protein YckC